MRKITSNDYMILELHGPLRDSVGEVTLSFFVGETKIGEFNAKKQTGKLEWYNAVANTTTVLTP